VTQEVLDRPVILAQLVLLDHKGHLV
jgi:hypothetical protein